MVGALLCFAGTAPLRAYGQAIPGSFPTGVPGYDQELGVTVVSRLRPLFEERGIRVGDFIVRTDLAESAGYNTNVVGLSGGRGSPVIETNPSVSAHSDWSRDALGADVSADNFVYPDTPNQNHTNWTAALGGGYTIGRGDLTLAYAHLQQYESPTSIGAPPTTTPIPYTVDDARAAYRFELGRLEVTPNFEVSLLRYGDAVIGGATVNQAFRDVNEFRGGVAFRYALAGRTALLFTVQGIDSEFIHPVPGTPSSDSTSGLALGGIDYQYDGVWRYQVLVGAEVRHFAASQFKTRVAPIASAAAIWTPTGLTTVTATLQRTIEEPVQLGTSGYTDTAIEFRVDHEYLRNLLLNARTGVERIAYLQNGGTQTAAYAGVGTTWLINRHTSLNAQYTYTKQTSLAGRSVSGSQPPSTFGGQGYEQQIFLVTIRLGI